MSWAYLDDHAHITIKNTRSGGSRKKPQQTKVSPSGRFGLTRCFQLTTQSVHVRLSMAGTLHPNLAQFAMDPQPLPTEVSLRSSLSSSLFLTRNNEANSSDDSSDLGYQFSSTSLGASNFNPLAASAAPFSPSPFGATSGFSNNASTLIPNAAHPNELTASAFSSAAFSAPQNSAQVEQTKVRNISRPVGQLSSAEPRPAQLCFQFSCGPCFSIPSLSMLRKESQK